ncbi:MAG: thioredoxin domain-containing protein [Candidatus Thorarchaeota archaeon]
MDQNRQINHLADETSPYLRQHMYNPVEWYPWDKGLTKAKQMNKPLLISIGYAACHWCHVMEEESFEDPETAELMNDLFINIKIDREERPDLDSLYQKAVSLLTKRSGGWPLTVFATPTGEAFAGGTYFPKKAKYGLPSFKKVLKSVSTEYKKNIPQIQELTHHVLNSLEGQSTTPATIDPTTLKDVLDSSMIRLLDQMDDVFGGFGVQPKFPQVSDLRFLLLSYYHRQNRKLLKPITLTLDNMAAGGIYDHLGYGFHRYSVDRKWLVPHFEKMLYDNSQLILLYLEAYQVTKRHRYAEIVHEIVEYLLREMTHPRYGGFYSSQDADSEGVEGKFFIWKPEEIQKALDKEGKRFKEMYDVTEDGNFENGYSILHETANLGKINENENSWEEIKQLKRKLFLQREKRVKPFLNDNIIVAWNALTIYAFARASFVLNKPEYLSSAEKAVNFILDVLRDTKGRLYRNFCEKTKGLAFAEDFALIITALLEVFSRSGKRRYLTEAIQLQAIFDKEFWDAKNFGYFFVGKWQEDIAVREKPVVTFSLPSANAVSLENLLRLYHYTGKETYLERAEHQVHFLFGWFEENSYLGGDSLIALDMFFRKPIEIIIFGVPKNEDSESTEKFLRTTYIPHSVTIHINIKTLEDLRHLPLLKHRLKSQNYQEWFDGTTFICRNFTCSLPLKSGTEIDLYLKQSEEKKHE